VKTKKGERKKKKKPLGPNNRGGPKNKTKGNDLRQETKPDRAQLNPTNEIDTFSTKKERSRH